MITRDRWTLDDSRDRVLGAGRTGRHPAAALTQATAARMVAAWTLRPAPADPAAHVIAEHLEARRHLARLVTHDPAVEVRSPMTNEMFSRLTRSEAGSAPIDWASVETYTYTP